MRLIREEAWRVIDESGDTHETTVRRLVHESGIWIEVVIGGKSDRFQMSHPVRASVAQTAAMRGIAVSEVLDPGQDSRAELVSALKRREIAWR